MLQSELSLESKNRHTAHTFVIIVYVTCVRRFLCVPRGLHECSVISWQCGHHCFAPPVLLIQTDCVLNVDKLFFFFLLCASASEGSCVFVAEYEDGSLSSWVNKERFQGYLQIDGFTLYELGETGGLCVTLFTVQSYVTSWINGLSAPSVMFSTFWFGYALLCQVSSTENGP